MTDDEIIARLSHPSAQVRYCVCGHAEQHHQPACTVRRTSFACECDAFSFNSRRNNQ